MSQHTRAFELHETGEVNIITYKCMDKDTRSIGCRDVARYIWGGLDLGRGCHWFWVYFYSFLCIFRLSFTGRDSFWEVLNRKTPLNMPMIGWTWMEKWPATTAYPIKKYNTQNFSLHQSEHSNLKLKICQVPLWIKERAPADSQALHCVERGCPEMSREEATGQEQPRGLHPIINFHHSSKLRHLGVQAQHKISGL